MTNFGLGPISAGLFAYSKLKFGLPVISQLNTVEGIRAYLALVTRPMPFEAQLKEPSRSPSTGVDMFLEFAPALNLVKTLTEELAKRPDAAVEQIVSGFALPASPQEKLDSHIKLLTTAALSCPRQRTVGPR